MAERFNTRDVKNKEIYDSYMGILRISPNEINGNDVDDPTAILNTLYDEYNKRRTTITLSDSDGNVLPLNFKTRAFQTKVLKRNENNTADIETDVDVINISSVIGHYNGDDTKFTNSTLYVSNTMKCRSTLQIIRDEEEEEDYIIPGDSDEVIQEKKKAKEQKFRHSVLRILSGGEQANSEKTIQGKGWLLYPSESPNDKNYFNDKNKYQMFKTDDIMPRHEQVDKTLYEWSRKEHEKIQSERVIIGNKIINEINQYNEEIPIYYTRDYILGQFDGHSFPTNTKNNTSKENWGISGESGEGITDHITKLSWTRIDKLIWQSLEQILTGEERHVKGRYNELGKDELAAPGILDKLNLDDPSHTYKSKAPILGTEMARGTITYHAMPFHRYWFYRTKQVLRNLIERRKMTMDDIYSSYKSVNDIMSLDEYVISLSLAANGGESNSYGYGQTIGYEINDIQKFANNKLIYPSPTATVGFANSLGKNFIICNGRTIKFDNFPNISLTNECIFDTGDLIGGFAKFDKGNNSFIHREYKNGEVFYALKNSSLSDIVKLPNLFALYEKSPRFIRGLFWQAKEHDKTVIVFNKDSSETNYVEMAEENEIFPLEIIKNDEEISVDELDQHRIINKRWNDISKLNFHTFDHLIKKEKHCHYLFSGTEGGVSGLNDVILNYSFYDMKDGTGIDGNYGQFYPMKSTKILPFDRVYSLTEWFTMEPFKQRAEKDFKSKCFSNISIKLPCSPSTLQQFDDGGAWAQYCMGDKNNVYDGGFYEKFTPIPNIGLYLFNTSIFNNVEFQKYEITVPSDDPNDPEPKTETVYEGFDVNSTEEAAEKRKDRGYHQDCVKFKDAAGNWHVLSEEAPINVKEITDTKSLKDYDAEKQRRKFYAMKLNEAEGFIPISYFGKAGGNVKIKYSRKEAYGPSGAKTKRRSYYDTYHNISGYKMSAPVKSLNADNVVQSYDDEKSFWRCFSSIPYLNPYKLGVGDIKNYIPNKLKNDETVDYYDINCVTQLPNKDEYKNYKFGGVNIQVDESCPTPAHLNLLPLIRI